MRVSEIWGIKKTYKRQSRLSKLIFLMIPLFGITSLLLGIITFYGQFTGDLSIKVEDSSEQMIRLSENEETTGKTVIRYPGVNFVNQTSYAGVIAYHVKSVQNTDGYYQSELKANDKEVTGFTFYVTNMNESATINRINYKLLLTDLKNHIEEHIRIMIIIDEVINVYEYESMRINDVQSLSFIDSNIAVNGNIYQLPAKKSAKISVIIWLDGYLHDYLVSSQKYEEKDLSGGSLKLQMTFNVNQG